MCKATVVREADHVEEMAVSLVTMTITEVTASQVAHATNRCELYRHRVADNSRSNTAGSSCPKMFNSSKTANLSPLTDSNSSSSTPLHHAVTHSHCQNETSEAKKGRHRPQHGHGREHGEGNVHPRCEDEDVKPIDCKRVFEKVAEHELPGHTGETTYASTCRRHGVGKSEPVKTIGSHSDRWAFFHVVGTDARDNSIAHRTSLRHDTQRCR